jgi:hypothetical protein
LLTDQESLLCRDLMINENTWSRFIGFFLSCKWMFGLHPSSLT